MITAIINLGKFIQLHPYNREAQLELLEEVELVDLLRESLDSYVGEQLQF